MKEAIANILKNLRSYIQEFVSDPLTVGLRIAFFILQVGAAAWVVLYTLNFVTHMLGL
mgnify:CR=1 FL=1